MAYGTKDNLIISQFAFSMAWILFAIITWIISKISPMSPWGTGMGWFAAICWFIAFSLGIAAFAVVMKGEQFTVTKKDKQ